MPKFCSVGISSERIGASPIAYILSSLASAGPFCGPSLSSTSKPPPARRRSICCGIGGSALNFEGGFVFGSEREAPSCEHFVRARRRRIACPNSSRKRSSQVRASAAISDSILRTSAADGRLRIKREMQPRGVTFAKREIVVEQLAFEAGSPACSESVADLRRERLARHQHQRHDLLATGIRKHAEADSASDLVIDQKADLVANLLDRGAKQFFLGKAVERGDNFLVVVRAGSRALRP